MTRLPQPGPTSLTATRLNVPSSPTEKVETVPSPALETKAHQDMRPILVVTSEDSPGLRRTRLLRFAGSADVRTAGDHAQAQAAVPITTVHGRIDHERTKPLIT